MPGTPEEKPAHFSFRSLRQDYVSSIAFVGNAGV
jgi:hypothetical protein